MSQQQSGFVPTMVDDRAIRLKADYVKGQRTAELAFTKRGNKPALVAYMNDDAKSKIDVRLQAPAFWAILEALKNALRAQDASQNIRLVVKEPGGKNPDGSFNPPKDKAIVSAGRDPKTNRLFVALTDATNEALRKQFFFRMPGFMDLHDSQGQKIDEVKESEMATSAWISMIGQLMSAVLVKDYKDFRSMGGGNRGGGNRGGYNNAGPAPAASNQQGGDGNGGNKQDFSDDEFAF